MTYPIVGFKQDEKGIHGVAAAWSLASDLHIIIMAPDMAKLSRAFDKLGCEKLNESLCKFVIGLSTEELNHYEPKTQLHEIMSQRTNEKIWMLHSESNTALMGYRWNLSQDLLLAELGPVVRGTVIECKILLRQEGWSREEIDKLNISGIDPDEDIPF